MGYCSLLELLSSDKWTREEHILVFNLYCRIPSGQQHRRAPEVIWLARLLGRSANSVADPGRFAASCGLNAVIPG